MATNTDECVNFVIRKDDWNVLSLALAASDHQ